MDENSQEELQQLTQILSTFLFLFLETLEASNRKMMFLDTIGCAKSSTQKPWKG